VQPGLFPNMATWVASRRSTLQGANGAALTSPNWPPWENGYIESFNARLRDELLDGEIFYSLEEARSGGILAATRRASVSNNSNASF
jgi:hypothetical protein